MNTRTILNCIGIACLALIIVNLISFGFEITQNGIGENWSVKFKHGVFSLNDNPTGLAFGSLKANGFMLLVFLTSIAKSYYQKGKFSIS